MMHVFLTLLVTLLPSSEASGGEIIRGLPCVKRLNQLFCPSAGNTYPTTKVNKFLDDNKALMRRMFGELQQPSTVTRTTVRVVRTFNGASFAISPFPSSSSEDTIVFPRFRRDVLEGTLDELQVEEMDELDDLEESVFGSENNRTKRQADFPGTPTGNKNKVDVCDSTVEIVTPYWASNSNGKVRAVLNNKEFEQAIHQEICSQPKTARCTRDCSCEQKYKWHRLLAYDPNNDCAGIFMDWFLFPSCCVCRCNKNPFLPN